jgi:DNA-binding NarL/FixJ family response regulator
MSSKTVLIVEDEKTQRDAMVPALTNRGFIARGVGTVAEANEVIEELGENIDVMILDMVLEDPHAPGVTGANIGIEVQAKHPTWLPEYLIQSQHDKVDYYQLALRLGAAAYLVKRGAQDVVEIVRHVRALALRRALRLERPKVAERLTAIVDSTKNLSTAVRSFCSDILKDELDNCLGTPYVLLLTDETGTHNFATNTDLPLGHEPIYTTLQAMAHGISNFSTPYLLNEAELKKIPGPTSANEVKIRERLDRAAFIPLANLKIFRLSLGLLPPRPSEAQYPEDTGKLAAVLAQYVRSTVVEHILRILVHLDSQKRAMLKSTSRLCMFLGQDQQEIIEDGIVALDLKPGSKTHEKLINLADDLRDTGTILTNVASSDSKFDYPAFDGRNLVENAAEDLRKTRQLSDIKLAFEGECKIKAKSDDVYIAVIRVLQWLAQRRSETPPDIDQQIYVHCDETNALSSITFEDCSNRLPHKLREQLFMPFSISAVHQTGTKLSGPGLYLPLFLAKMLVEEKYGGGLDDRSDEITSSLGHRLVMSFPSHQKVAKNGKF